MCLKSRFMKEKLKEIWGFYWSDGIEGGIAFILTVGFILVITSSIIVVFVEGISSMQEKALVIQIAVTFIMMIIVILDVIRRIIRVIFIVINTRMISKKLSSLGSQRFHFSLPSDDAEEILGDLSEMKMLLEEAGHSKWQIWETMTRQKISILLSLKYQQVTDWLSQQTRINK